MRPFLLLLLISAVCFSTSSTTATTISDTAAAPTSIDDHSAPAKQAVLAENLDQAVTLIEEAIERDPEHAESYRVAGDIYVVQARSASLFSAPGLARKALKNYKMAVETEPSNPRYKLNLMQYYLNAPSIVGGDEDKAVELAGQIEKLDSAMGVVARSTIYRKNNELDNLRNLFAKLSKDQLSDPQVRLERAQYLILDKKEAEGLKELNLLASLDPDSLVSEENKKIPSTALLVMGFAGLQNNELAESAIDGFQKYINSAPQSYGYPDRQWIRLSLAQVLANNDKKVLAKATLETIQRESKSKELLKETKKALKNL